jgi:hypothetical protein
MAPKNLNLNDESLRTLAAWPDSTSTASRWSELKIQIRTYRDFELIVFAHALGLGI